MQTILGAGGAIGLPLARALTAYGTRIRLASRHPKKVNEGDELFQVDLTKRDDAFRAVSGSTIVYLTVGLPYDIRVWRAQWPPLMRNVLDACREHRAKLVFLDNVYAIGAPHVHHITEESPISPTSRKGEVRADLVRMIERAIETKDLDAMIVRSADFYGPVRATSQLMILVYDNLAKGKRAQWLFDARVKHTFTYTPDAATAVARLGNSPEAYNQVWNLPTSREALTGEQWIRLFAQVMGTSDRYWVLPAWMVGGLSVVVPFLRELYEMRYQFDRDYVFDSSKYERAFGVSPTPPPVAVRETVEALRGGKRVP